MNVLETLMQNPHVDLKHLSVQCLLLSKILDSLVANQRMPLWRQELLTIIKQVCKHKESQDMKASLLILLLSVKNAYRVEWLSSGQVTERDEVFATLKVLFDSFTTVHEVSGNAPVQLLQAGGSAVEDIQEARAYLDLISSRFYPRLQVSNVFVAVQAKVGYEVLMCDFHVPHMHLLDRVRLYVGQKGLAETSTCIITPPQANILVNGQQVERRVSTGYLDAGPQMPSDVTTLVKVGANVLQVIGEFSVSYIIAVTSSRTIERSARSTELEEYVAPTTAANGADPTEVDDEVVEGASRVSLRCPVSHQRLVTPVKASTCRHLQCFDYDSFLEINEKRPAWRCPCCNRLISCPDLRIDRQMEKVLKETDEKVQEVIFYQDGSWVPASTGGDQTDIGPDVEGSEMGRKVIDLSDEEEPVNGMKQNIDLFQQHERKPDAQTLQAIIGNRDIPSQSTNPVVQQRDTVGRPHISVPEFTTAAPQSSRSFAGPSRVGGSRNDGTFVNGSILYGSIPGTVEMPVQNQSAPSVQSPSAVNHNFQATFAHLSPANRSAPNRAYIPSDQLQQPQTVAPSNIGPVNQGETRWVWQRQVGQQSVGTSQNVQELGQTRPQWRSTGVSQHQLGTNAAQPQTAQQLYANQSPVSNSPRQQHASLGVNSHQHPSSQRNPHVHHHPSPGVNAQQMPVHWGGGAHPGQWRSTSPTQAQLNTPNAGASDQNWRPSQRMRGSVTNPALGHGPSSPAFQLHRLPVASPVNTFPPTQPFGFNTPQANVVPPISFSFYGMDPVPILTNPAVNVSLYNGTSWVNGSEFSSAPMFGGVQTSDGWLSFENVSSGIPPGHPH